jgi:hypothetical protein
MFEHPELLAIHRALDELSRQACGLRHRFGNTLDVNRFAEDVARLRTDCALLPRSPRGATSTSPERTAIPDDADHRNSWRDDEGLGGFARTLGRSA